MSDPDHSRLIAMCRKAITSFVEDTFDKDEQLAELDLEYGFRLRTSGRGAAGKYAYDTMISLLANSRQLTGRRVSYYDLARLALLTFEEDHFDREERLLDLLHEYEERKRSPRGAGAAEAYACDFLFLYFRDVAGVGKAPDPDPSNVSIADRNRVK